MVYEALNFSEVWRSYEQLYEGQTQHIDFSSATQEQLRLEAYWNFSGGYSFSSPWDMHYAWTIDLSMDIAAVSDKCMHASEEVRLAMSQSHITYVDTL